MDLQLDQQQELLRQSLDRYLAKHLTFEARRTQCEGEAFLDFWKGLDDKLGVGAAGLAEDLGGFGGGPESEMIVAGALGRALAVTPYVPCHVLSAALLANLGCDDLVRRIATGDLLVVTAIEEPQTRGEVARVAAQADRIEGGWRLSGTKLVVDFAAQAGLVLVPARIAGEGLALFAVDHARFGDGLKPFALIDNTPSADLLLDGLELDHDSCIAQGEGVLAALSAAVDRARAAICAEAAGIAAVLVADTVAYAKEREQFGVAIASFQALQHRMVDMWAKAQEIEAASLLATLKPDQPDAVSAAMATVSDGLRKIGQEAVQLHGAMGLTEELRVGHYFKRATVIEHRLGSAADQVERYRERRLSA